MKNEFSSKQISEILDSVYDSLGGFWFDEIPTTPSPTRLLVFVMHLQMDVMSNGFDSYFRISGPISAPFIADDLELLCAPMTADIVRNAIATAFPDGLPLTPKEIEAVARNFDAAMVDKLEPFDWQFLAQPERLTDLLFEFIQRHPGTFGALPAPGART